jgi:hypothetical protein
MSDMPRPDARLHATHDPELVAAYAAGDATGPQLAAAEARVASCAKCATLHRDLRAIMAALPAMPAPVRPRDFRLTPEVAASLRPSRFRRLLAPFASARFAFAGPAGAGLAALGLAGILISGGLGIPALPGLGSAASTATTTSADRQAPSGPDIQGLSETAAPVPAPSTAPSVAASSVPGGFGQATASQDRLAAASPGDAPFPNRATGSSGDKQAGAMSSAVPVDPGLPAASSPLAPGPASTTPVALLGIGLLVAGVLMIGVRWAARHLL